MWEKCSGYGHLKREEFTGDKHYNWEECTGVRHYVWAECTGTSNIMNYDGGVKMFSNWLQTIRHSGIHHTIGASKTCYTRYSILGSDSPTKLWERDSVFRDQVLLNSLTEGYTLWHFKSLTEPETYRIYSIIYPVYYYVKRNSKILSDGAPS